MNVSIDFTFPGPYISPDSYCTAYMSCLSNSQGHLFLAHLVLTLGVFIPPTRRERLDEMYPWRSCVPSQSAWSDTGRTDQPAVYSRFSLSSIIADKPDLDEHCCMSPSGLDTCSPLDSELGFDSTYWMTLFT